VGFLPLASPPGSGRMLRITQTFSCRSNVGFASF